MNETDASLKELSQNKSLTLIEHFLVQAYERQVHYQLREVEHLEKRLEGERHLAAERDSSERIRQILEVALARYEQHLELVDKEVEAILKKDVSEKQKAALEALDKVLKDEEEALKKIETELEDKERDAKDVVKEALEEADKALKDTESKLEELVKNEDFNQIEKRIVFGLDREAKALQRIVEFLLKELE